MLAKVKKASKVDEGRINEMLSMVSSEIDQFGIQYFLLENENDILLGIIGIQSLEDGTNQLRPLVMKKECTHSQLIEFLGVVVLYSEQMKVEELVVNLSSFVLKEVFELFGFVDVSHLKEYKEKYPSSLLILKRECTNISD